MALVLSAPYPSGGGGTRLWTPADATAPAVYMADALGTFTTVGGELDTLTNTGSMGGLATARTSARRPDYTADYGDGLPAFVFASADQLVGDRVFSLAAGSYLLFVGAEPATTSGQRRYFSQGQSGDEPVAGGFWRTQNGVWQTSLEGSGPGNQVTNQPSFPSSTTQMALVRNTNNKAIPTNTGGSGGFKYLIGGYLNGDYWVGAWRGVYFLPPETTAADLLRWIGWIGWRWKPPGSAKPTLMASTETYYDAAPTVPA